MPESEYQAVPLTEQGIRLDQISEMGASVPPGKYKLKLSRVEAKDSNAGNPMIVAGFDVLDGTPAVDPVTGVAPDINTIIGLECSKFFTMYVGKNAKGRTIAPGIMEIKAMAAAIGKPLADDFVFPGRVQDAARLVHDLLHPKSAGELEAFIVREKDRKDANKMRTNVRIIGRWGQSGSSEMAAPAAAGASGGYV